MILLWVIFAVLLIFLGVGAYVFFRACLRTKDLPWLDREAILKTSYAPHVDRILSAHDWLLAHNAREIWTQSRDGLNLRGLWVEAENPVGTMLLAHGYHSTYLADFSGALAFYHRQGLNLLIPDQRCHGKSGGRYITFGVKESSDMLCWLEYMQRELWAGPVVLSGLSMGASTVLYMADETLPEEVRGIIADCGFSSPAAIIGKVFTDVTHLPPVPWIYSVELFARAFGKFSLWQKDAVRSMSRNTRPVLFVHGSDDDFVPYEMTKIAYQASGGNKTFLLVEGAGHGVSFLVDKQGYSARVKALLTLAFGEAYELRNDQKQ